MSLFFRLCALAMAMPHLHCPKQRESFGYLLKAMKHIIIKIRLDDNVKQIGRCKN
jgi:hypothetical protein